MNLGKEDPLAFKNLSKPQKVHILPTFSPPFTHCTPTGKPFSYLPPSGRDTNYHHRQLSLDHPTYPQQPQLRQMVCLNRTLSILTGALPIKRWLTWENTLTHQSWNMLRY